MTHPPDPSASDSDGADDSLKLTFEFDTPVTAEDLRERFQELADAMDDVQEDSAEGHDRQRPRRSEPADFGGGESTGVQDL